MDFISVYNELNILTQCLIERSEEYNKKRMEAAEARKHLYILLAAKQDDSRYRSAALDRQLLFLLNENQDDPGIFKIYSEMILAEEAYKGLEKLITAYQTKISALQSLMKWSRE